ncbi:hypothetical protein NW754_016746 [Fusarium falciforme]|nr:hypothetical protein NW754_016746 [Fusarium falciforme]
MTNPSRHHVVKSDGIFHGLPTYPDNLEGLTAIVTGTNGISGHHLLESCRALGGGRRSTLFREGRQHLEVCRPNAEHLALDFLESPEAISKVLKERGVHATVTHVILTTGDYVFFFSYIQVAPKDGGCPMVQRTRDEPRETGISSRTSLTPWPCLISSSKRFITADWGQVLREPYWSTEGPAGKWDPRVPLQEPSFYYDQEDILWDYHKRSSVEWGPIVMPAAILGGV